MKAELLLQERHGEGEDAFVELRIWHVPIPVPSSTHEYKYSLAYVVGGECVLRYDNEAGKGDHKHVGSAEASYNFVGPGKLIADFWSDVDAWRSK